MKTWDVLRLHLESAETAIAGGRLHTALGHYQQYLRLAPDDLEVRQRAADLLVRLNRPQAAVRAYEHVATSFASGGHLFKSIAISSVIQQLDPDHTRTQQKLAESFSGRDPATDDTQPAQRLPTPRAPRLAVGITTPVAVSAIPTAQDSVRFEIDVDDIVEELQTAPLPLEPARPPRFALFCGLTASISDSALLQLAKVQRGG